MAHSNVIKHPNNQQDNKIDNHPDDDNKFNSNIYYEPTIDVYGTTTDDAIKQEIDRLKKQARKWKINGDIDNDDHLVIFLHGYNNKKDDINKRGNKIDNKLGTKKIVTTTFNWKSFEATLKYKSDQQRAENCAQHFAKYIEYIRNDNQFNKIDIIAHSMGNYLLSETVLLCDLNNKLHIFAGFNIICLAADVEINQYENTINKLKNIVESWTHYYNAFDYALFASNIVNSASLRAGQCKCKIHGVESIRWLTPLNGHGYIDDVFANDTQLSINILNKLKLEPEPKEYLLLFKGKECGSGETWWIDINCYNKFKKKYGILKLQQHESSSSVVGFARTFGWWSNHNDKYRIVLKSEISSKNIVKHLNGSMLINPLNLHITYSIFINTFKCTLNAW